MRSRRWLSLVLVACVACAGKPIPPRFVIESDLGGYRYRRYQRVLDVELPVPANPSVGHLATYVREGDPGTIVPVFITRYAHAAGLAESLRARLAALSAYTLDVESLSRQHVWRLRGESGDVWLLWVSGRQLVKIGAPEGAAGVPPTLAAAYLAQYPSDLDAKGE